MKEYVIKWSARFKKDYQRAIKRGLDREKMHTLIGLLAMGEKLPSQYRDHALKGDAIGRRECHIGGPKSDWLLVYERDDSILRILLIRTGTHADVFG